MPELTQSEVFERVQRIAADYVDVNEAQPAETKFGDLETPFRLTLAQEVWRTLSLPGRYTEGASVETLGDLVRIVCQLKGISYETKRGAEAVVPELADSQLT